LDRRVRGALGGADVNVERQGHQSQRGARKGFLHKRGDPVKGFSAAKRAGGAKRSPV